MRLSRSPFVGFIGAVTLAAASLLPVSAEETADKSERVRDLPYGVTLYHYYQQQYFDALTELIAAQAQQRLPHHGDEAELLRGGISLSYGLDRQARDVFDKLLEQPRDDVDRDRAWFYLGKLSWRRGEIGDSAQALGMMAPAYAGPVADEGHYLRAIQALMAGNESDASAQLQLMASPCPFKPYYFYNLGAQRAAAGRWQDAADAYSQVGDLACTDTEGRNLRDRAEAAAGFAYLAANDTVAARLAYQRVRLDSPESDRALLGYGWSYANTGDYAGALGPWQVLAERGMFSASARESQLAIPYAYEQLQQPGLALQQYQQAAVRYAVQRNTVEAITTQVEQQDLNDLFGLEALADLAWLGGEDPAPVGEHGAYLAELLAADQVQLALREYRDLTRLDRELNRARERLAVLEQVDREQREVWLDTASGGRAEALLNRRQALQAQVQQLQEQVATAVAREDARALATTEQQALWARLEQAEASAARLNKPEQGDKLRLMRGLMQWRDSENFAARRWHVQRELQLLIAETEQSALAEAALRDALQLRERPVYADRIASMLDRVADRQATVTTALAAAESKLRQAALDELESQRQLLARSEANALLAVARLYDEASAEVPR